MKHLVFPLGFLLLSPFSSMAESYLCIAEQSAGFVYNEDDKEWKSSTFKAGNKYIVSRPEEGTSEANDQVKWTVKLHGVPAEAQSRTGDLTLAPTQCRTEFDEGGFLRCRGARDLIMNRDTMRFTTIWNLGYVTRKGAYDRALGPEGKYSPYMEIGECSAL